MQSGNLPPKQNRFERNKREKSWKFVDNNKKKFEQLQFRER